MVLHQEPSGGAVPLVHRKKARETGELVVGASSRHNKLEVIEAELQKLVQHGLDGLWVFHTFFHHRVAPLAEKRRPMWMYSGPTDPDRASPEELAKDKV